MLENENKAYEKQQFGLAADWIYVQLYPQGN